jgi:proteasome component ECM29
VWLTTLLSYNGRHLAMTARLKDIHEALSQLLGDPNELTQEMASRGMSLVYELGDEETKQECVGALVGAIVY